MAGGAVVGDGGFDGPLGAVRDRLNERLAAVEAEAQQLRTALEILARHAPAMIAITPRAEVTAPVSLAAPRVAAHARPAPRAPAMPNPHAAPKDSGVRFPIPVRVALTRGKTGTTANAPIRARAFEYYRTLGQGRRLKTVASDLGIPLTTIQRWAKRERWAHRVSLPPPDTGPVAVEDSSSVRGGHVSRNAASPAFALPLDEVAVELCNALEERGPLTDREFVGHCRDGNLFADATDAAIALAFSNVVHDEPKMFRRRKGVVELVK